MSEIWEHVALLPHKPEHTEFVYPPDITEPTDPDILHQRINDRAQRLGGSNTPPNFRRGDQSEYWLHVSENRKTSPEGWYQEKDGRWVPIVPNTLGLPPVESCPGATIACKSKCYAINSQRSDGVAEALRRNFEMLRSEDIDGMELLLFEMTDRCNNFMDARNVAPEDKLFKFHWSGDFFSLEYAIAVARVMKNFPQMKFWIYTRSYTEELDVLPVITGIPNAVVHLSKDKDNQGAADQAAEEYGDLVRKSVLVESYDDKEQLVPGNEKHIVCPENLGRMALMENGVGACVKCKACFRDDGPTIVFLEKKNPVLKKGEYQPQLFANPATPNEVKKRSAKTAA